ncbi:hypothetical protein LDENG_00258600, partial [Lucifuga dentata]
MTQMEGQLSEVLQGSDGGLGSTRNPVTAKTTPQDYYDPDKKYLTHTGGRILERHTQSRTQGTTYTQINSHSQPTLKNRTPPQPYQHQETPNQPKHLKAQDLHKTLLPKPESRSYIQANYQTRKPQTAQPQPFQTQNQEHPRPPRSQTRSYLPHQEHNPQLQPHLSTLHHYPQIQQPPQAQPHPHQKTPGHPKLTRNRQMRPRLGTPQFKSYQPQGSNWNRGEEEETDAKRSAIHNFLQLPARHKIPVQPVPKKDATICNVDSMLFFPFASVENYVTFSQSFPDLPEFSMCLWLCVENAHIGTLLSYATADNDNQLVLYGRNSSSLLSSASSSPSHPSSSSSSSSFSSLSLDFVVGDPVYRRLPAAALLDGRWHHLCILWSSIQGHFWHYTDRRLTSSGSNFQKGWEVPGGGSVVLG